MKLLVVVYFLYSKILGSYLCENSVMDIFFKYFKIGRKIFWIVLKYVSMFLIFVSKMCFIFLVF